MFDWAHECEAEYHDIVRVIASYPVVFAPDFKLPFELNTGASHYATLTVLYQRDTEKQSSPQLQVVGTFSNTFTNTEVCYTTTEKEALSVLKVVRCFRSYPECSEFKLCSDHEILAFLLKVTEQ